MDLSPSPRAEGETEDSKGCSRARGQSISQSPAPVHFCHICNGNNKMIQKPPTKFFALGGSGDRSEIHGCRNQHLKSRGRSQALKGGGGRHSRQDTRSPALWVSSGCLRSVEGTRLGAAGPPSSPPPSHLPGPFLWSPPRDRRPRTLTWTCGGALRTKTTASATSSAFRH